MQVMLLGFVLLGRSLEEKARIQASSDMNELLAQFDSTSLGWLMRLESLEG